MPINLDGGRDVALRQNPITGRWDIQFDDETNELGHDDSDAHAVLSVLLEDQEGYWADSTGQRGSLLSKIRDAKTGVDQLVVSYCSQALQFIVDKGIIREVVSVTASRTRPGRVDAAIRYRNRGGHEKNLVVPFGD